MEQQKIQGIGVLLSEVTGEPTKLQKTKDELLNRFKEYLDSQEELSPDNINMMKFLPYLLKLQNTKSLIYGRSYCRHGDLSIFLNTERKWDRISNIMDNAMKAGMDTLYSDKSATPTETFVDTVVDLASYGMLWAAYIMETHPEDFQRFIENNKIE